MYTITGIATRYIGLGIWKVFVATSAGNRWEFHLPQEHEAFAEVMRDACTPEPVVGLEYTT